MADRLISADALKEYVREQVNLPLPKDRLYIVVPIEDFITNLIDNAPTIEPKYDDGMVEHYAELERHKKRGRWKGAGMGDYMCSLCAEVVSGNRWHYCPNCGAKMDVPDKNVGKWIDVNGDGSLWRCSACGETQCCKSSYCGDCGAQMMDEVEE